MCQSKANGGKRCDAQIRKDALKAAKQWDGPDAGAGQAGVGDDEHSPMVEPAKVRQPSMFPGLPKNPARAAVAHRLNPDQDSRVRGLWPGVKAEVTIKRDVIVADGVITATPARGGVDFASDAHRDDIAPDGQARNGVVTVVHPVTREYEVFRARLNAAGTWDVGRPIASGDRLPPKPVTPDGFR